LLARGFISFFTHYLMHKVPLLWRLHRVHHLDTELDVSTTVRFHPFEFLAALIPGVPLVVAFGMSPWVLMLYEILDAVVTLFSHANIRLPESLDRLLRYVIVTPDLHRVHHSSWQTETDSNFSAVFPIWDIVFKTFRTETRVSHETMELGLEEVRDERANRFLWLLGSPFLGRLKRKSEAPISNL
jgi:sterol desaturase/sphingolipid hydroxylase (fatty acid hydroxylase superfamily)